MLLLAEAAVRAAQARLPRPLILLRPRSRNGAHLSTGNRFAVPCDGTAARDFVVVFDRPYATAEALTLEPISTAADLMARMHPAIHVVPGDEYFNPATSV